MSKVGSIRWNNLALFEHAKAYAESRHEKMNAVIMEAISEYLKNKVTQVSKLKSQTKAFPKDSFNTSAWVNGHDTQGWE